MDLNGSPNNPATTPHEGDVCVRCGGMMVLDHYIDLPDDTGQIGLDAWRCMSCGEVIDPVILDNRFRPAPNLIYGTKQRKYAQRIEPENAAGNAQQGNGSSP